ncbi:endonuclease/exonuclease/phosphatase family protein [Vagococcus hydrophili]|uniref:Endonuclease/exonuclease/phosphatase family protein n=1 Tax=Vagococcus hydrophili TaxID=2714947 RepID=A0A6G8AXT7_9ENTE|nr:endonuclease/exonuclease/phosphatase family protein [Vagococcus hydrophili]QIL49779.1 endonuclease/exonuclease/phosphatase family protein [Vagococcus hydrophili]
MKVATYNVRTDTDFDQNWSWDYRKNHVIDLIKFHDWDILGVQEIRPNQVNDLKSLSEYASFTREREGDQTDEGLGIYYRKTLFDCMGQGFFWLSDTPFESSIHPEAGCKRIALWIILKDKQSKQEFLVINTHLDHVSEVARQKGMDVLLEVLAKKINVYSTILLGDFNAEREEVLHDKLQEIFQYPEDNQEVFNYGPKGTFQEFEYERDWKDLEYIDYILYKDMICTKRGVLTDSCDGRFPSDHFPVVTTFKI